MPWLRNIRMRAGQRRVVGGDRPALARGDVLDRMETEGVQHGQRADGPALVAAADRVAGVGDQRQAVPVGDRKQPVVVAGLAGVIDRHDGLGLAA